jgi:hypothetical protein
MKKFALLLAPLVLLACENVPTAADTECHDRHGYARGSSLYSDCIDKLKSSEHELRNAK